MTPGFNTKQTKAFELLTRTEKNVFITGEAGTGKSFVIKKYIEYLENSNNTKESGYYAVLASTGIAASHLDGTTLHYFFGIKISKNFEEMKRLFDQKSRSAIAAANRIKNVSLLIIDEISMINSQLFDGLDQLCQYIRKNNKPFGGIRIIMLGDFFQLPPVERREESSSGDQNQNTPVPDQPMQQEHPEAISQENIAKKVKEKLGKIKARDPKSRIREFNETSAGVFCFSSQAWSSLNLSYVYFTEIVRQKETQFQTVLSKVRLGIIDHEVQVFLNKHKVESDDSLIEAPRLFTHRDDTFQYNMDRLGFEGTEFRPTQYHYKVRDEWRLEVNNDLSDKNNYPIDDFVALKVGARVMIRFNDTLSHQFVNGSCGVITKFEENIVEIELDKTKQTVIVCPQPFYLKDASGREYKKAENFPISTAYGFTIHKSQGMTLEKAVVDISKCFSGGQAYVALSRLKSSEGLSIIGLNFERIKANSAVIEFDRKIREMAD